MRIALIDLGTNSVRLHVLERQKKGELQPIFQRKEMIQLGVGLFSSGDFTADARARALSAFDELKEDLDRLEVEELHGVATCAMREAASGQALRSEIEERTGIAIEIISGEEEARLISEGVIDALGPFQERCLLVDIGGGSTELSYVKKSSVRFATSTRLGAVRCQEMLLETIPATSEKEDLLRAFIREELAETVPQEKRKKTATILGSSGSVRAIVRLIRGVESDGKECSAEELSNFVASLRGLSLEELLEHPGLEPKRGTIIFSASVILDEIAKELQIQTVQAIPLGLKDGLLLRLKK